MSVQQTRTGLWAVRWREAGRMRSKAFHRKRDAERFDLTVKTAKQTGTLAALDGGARDARRLRREHLGADPRRGARAEDAGALRRALRRARLAGARRLPAARTDARGHRALAGRPARRRRAGRVDAQGADAARRDPAARRRGRADPMQPAAARPQGGASAERGGAAAGAGDGRGASARLSAARREFVSLLAYAGLRPQEARALRWGHVGERTLTVHAPKTRRHGRSRDRCACWRRWLRTCASGGCYPADRATTSR